MLKSNHSSRVCSPSSFKTHIFLSHKHELHAQQVSKVLVGSTRSLLRRHSGETILLMWKFKNKDCAHWSHLELLSHKHGQRECLNSVQPDHLRKKNNTLCWELCKCNCYLFRTHFHVSEDIALTHPSFSAANGLCGHVLCHENSNIFLIISTKVYRVCVLHIPVLLNWAGPVPKFADSAHGSFPDY